MEIMKGMKVVIASQSPVKEEAVKRGFAMLFPDDTFAFECVKARSGISDQPMSDDETRTGALGRIAHARELSPEADYYIGLEGGVEEKYGDLYNFGWVVVESKSGKHGYGRTMSFAVPPAIRHLILNEGLELSHATDKLLSKSDTKTGTGTIGPLTKNALTYTDWYISAVVCALIPLANEALYPYESGQK
jgi:inosine/xanthosine triphosphatase